MSNTIKIFLRYLNAYGFYGIILFFKIYILKREKVSLKGYGNIYIRRDSFDKQIFTQMFIYRQYHFNVKNTVRTIVDLGGNNGMSALFFHKRYPDAKIYVLEPQIDNFKTLQQQISGIDNIVAINKAIWKENGQVNLDSGDSWTVKVDMESGTNLAEAITMESLLSTFQIDQVDILKIDIESAEKEVFESSTLFLNNTKNIVIELHDWLKPGCAQTFFRALNNFTFTYAVNHENTLITDLQRRTDS